MTASKLAIFLILISFRAYSHGMNEPGPHGGKIQMPGSFHTELILSDNSVKIFLLDMNFKNPSVKNSSVDVSIIHHGNDEKLTCIPKQDFFECVLKVPATMISTVKVKAVRERKKGTLATYKLDDNSITPQHH